MAAAYDSVGGVFLWLELRGNDLDRRSFERKALYEWHIEMYVHQMVGVARISSAWLERKSLCAYRAQASIKKRTQG